MSEQRLFRVVTFVPAVLCCQNQFKKMTFKNRASLSKQSCKGSIAVMGDGGDRVMGNGGDRVMVD